MWSLFIGIAVFTVAQSIPDIDLRINDQTGSFSILLDNVEWFRSGDVFVTVENQKLSTRDKSLKLLSVQNNLHGEDALGAFNEIRLNYGPKRNRVAMTGNIKTYQNSIVFEQTFEDGLEGTSTNFADGISSSFPSFEMFDGNGGDLGFAHWISWYYETATTDASRRKALVAPGFDTPTFNKWTNTTVLVGGIGGSGVTCIFDQQSTAVVLAPFNNFMVASHVSPEPGHLQFGIMGNVSSVPAKFSLKTMMFFSSNGINGAMQEWGSTLRSFYGKSNAQMARERDITLQYLGFTTDNGAYYYYNTEPGEDYEQTLVAVKAYADKVGLPYKYVLLDSWWYYRGANGGVANWTARPEIFPNGIESLYEKTGWLVQAHNRYWSRDAVYAKENGGKYDFVMDEDKDGAAPMDSQFWDDLFSYPKSAWGLRVYEQDWLFNEFYEYVGPMLSSVSMARTWLLQMGAGAQRAGLTIQYCMPYIRHLLQSVEVQAVTQARASDDYVASPYVGVDNWRIGGQSILINALGLAPSKDSFWSSYWQPGNPYGEERFEPYARLQAAVTTLSAGPVAIADGVDLTDVALVLRSCMKDGRLLQPSEPALKIDADMKGKAFPGFDGPDGEVWFARSHVAGRTFGYLFSADLKGEWMASPSDIFSTVAEKGKKYWAFEANSTHQALLDGSAVVPVRVSSSSPLPLKACGMDDFAVWSLAPIERNGWSLLGELDKWVGASSARIVSVDAHEKGPRGGITVTMRGVEGETITVGFADPDGDVRIVNCAFGIEAIIQIASDGSCAL